ncbi:NupC family nucleoside transporter, partial [Colletotrichum scovillei]
METSIQLGFSRPTSDLSTSSEVRYLLAKNTDLNTKGSNVTETAKSVGRNELGTGREIEVLGRLHFGEGNVLVLFTYQSVPEVEWSSNIQIRSCTYSNNLKGNQAGNLEKVAVTGNTQEERNRVEDVT